MKTLKKFDFPEFGAKSSYDWDGILCGKPVQLEEGEGKDYNCKTVTFCSLARSAAKKRGLVIQTAKVEGGVVIQSHPASKEQLKAWADADAKKASDKEAGDDEGGDDNGGN